MPLSRQNSPIFSLPRAIRDMQKFIFYFQYAQQTENWCSKLTLNSLVETKCFRFIKPIWEVIRR